MAQSAYSEGIPSVLPQVSVPDNYQRIPEVPEAFGAGIARGVVRAGEGLLAAGKLYGEVAADDAYNQYDRESRNILYGDPSKTVIGPDGAPGPDLGFRGLQGRAAMDAWPGVQKQLDDLRTKLAGGMITLDQQHRFETATRDLQSSRLAHAGQYLETQAHAWTTTVENDRKENGLNNLRDAAARGDEAGVERATAEIMQPYLRQAQRNAGPNITNETINAALNRGRAVATEAHIEALIPTNPTRAMEILQSPAGSLLRGPKYDTLYSKLKHAETQALAASLGELPTPSGSAAASDGSLWGRIKGAEGGVGRGGEALVSPKGAIGISQIIPSTAREMAADLGLPYDERRLHTDATYNETLGKGYLDKMLARYGGNEALAAAAYNAGPHRVDAWLQTIGDPRTGAITDADFARRIPFDETRNYVQKIISGTPREGLTAPAAATTAALPRQGTPEDKKLREEFFAYNQANPTATQSWAEFTNARVSTGGAAAPAERVDEITNPELAAQIDAAPAAGGPIPLDIVGAPDALTGRPAAGAPALRPVAGSPVTLPPGALAPGIAEIAAAQSQNAIDHARALERLAADPRGAANPEAVAVKERRLNLQYNSRELVLNGQMKAITETRNLAANEHVQGILREQQSGQIDPERLTKIIDDPRLDATTRSSLAAAYRAGVKKTAEGDTEKYGPKYFEQYALVTAPITNPNKIRDPSQIYPLAQPKADGTQDLTIAGVDKLTEILAKQKELTPGGIRLQTRRDKLIADVAPLIEYANPLMGKDKDASGKLMVDWFTYDLDEKIDEYRTAGKDPGILFNPNPANREYMGRPEALQPYIKTFQQSQKDFSNRLRSATKPAAPAAATPAAEPPPSLTSRQPGAQSIPGGVSFPLPAPAVPLRQPGESLTDFFRRVGVPSLTPAAPAAP